MGQSATDLLASTQLSLLRDSGRRNTRYVYVTIASILVIVAMYGVYIGWWTDRALSEKAYGDVEYKDVDAVKITITYVVPILNLVLSILPVYWLMGHGFTSVIDQKSVTFLRSTLRNTIVCFMTLLIVAGLFAPSVVMQSTRPTEFDESLRKAFGDRNGTIVWCVLCSILGLILTLVPNVIVFSISVLIPALKGTALATYTVSKFPRLFTSLVVLIAGSLGFGVGSITGLAG